MNSYPSSAPCWKAWRRAIIQWQSICFFQVQSPALPGRAGKYTAEAAGYVIWYKAASYVNVTSPGWTSLGRSKGKKEPGGLLSIHDCEALEPLMYCQSAQTISQARPPDARGELKKLIHKLSTSKWETNGSIQVGSTRSVAARPSLSNQLFANALKSSLKNKIPAKRCFPLAAERCRISKFSISHFSPHIYLSIFNMFKALLFCFSAEAWMI